MDINSLWAQEKGPRQRLARILSERGDQIVALIGHLGHADEVRTARAEPAVVDLKHANEEDVAGAVAGSDAVGLASWRRSGKRARAQ
jgi:hypothetical protein